MSAQTDHSNLLHELSRPVWIMRIIITSLTLGPLVFIGVSIYLLQAGVGFPAGGPDVLVPIGVVAAMLALAGSRIMQRVVATGSRRSIAKGSYPPIPSTFAAGSMPGGDAGQLCMVYQTKMIIGAAILEGASFFNTIAYLITGNPIALGTAIGLVLVIATTMPGPSGVAAWIEEQLRLLADERALGG